MTIVERAKAPLPKFFKILRTIGLTLLGISGSVIAAPVALPAAVVTVAGYIAVAGGVLSAVSQVTVDTSKSPLQAQEEKANGKKAKNEEDDYHQPEGGEPDG
jgi:ABC-type xylose transport system permease subunit